MLKELFGKVCAAPPQERAKIAADIEGLVFGPLVEWFENERIAHEILRRRIYRAIVTAVSSAAIFVLATLVVFNHFPRRPKMYIALEWSEVFGTWFVLTALALSVAIFVARGWAKSEQQLLFSSLAKRRATEPRQLAQLLEKEVTHNLKKLIDSEKETRLTYIKALHERRQTREEMRLSLRREQRQVLEGLLDSLGAPIDRAEHDFLGAIFREDTFQSLAYVKDTSDPLTFHQEATQQGSNGLSGFGPVFAVFSRHSCAKCSQQIRTSTVYQLRADPSGLIQVAEKIHPPGVFCFVRRNDVHPHYSWYCTECASTETNAGSLSPVNGSPDDVIRIC